VRSLDAGGIFVRVEALRKFLAIHQLGRLASIRGVVDAPILLAGEVPGQALVTQFHGLLVRVGCDKEVTDDLRLAQLMLIGELEQSESGRLGLLRSALDFSSAAIRSVISC
jgi:hypothetical protein